MPPPPQGRSYRTSPVERVRGNEPPRLISRRLTRVGMTGRPVSSITSPANRSTCLRVARVARSSTTARSTSLPTVSSPRETLPKRMTFRTACNFETSSAKRWAAFRWGSNSTTAIRRRSSRRGDPAFTETLRLGPIASRRSAPRRLRSSTRRQVLAYGTPERMASSRIVQPAGGEAKSVRRTPRCRMTRPTGRRVGSRGSVFMYG